MPTRKQRRRRAKEHRHEYVWEDAEGNELEPDDVRERAPSAPTRARAASRTGREPQRPSWTRTLKRAAIFAPIMFFVVSVLSKDLSIADRVVQTVLVVLVFIPFSYFLDGFFWRAYQRRVGRVEHPGRRGS
jgi:ferric-dicitrate binding protein FerR (iron transport regulator)